MRLVKITAVILLLCSIIFLSISCKTSSSTSVKATPTISTVSKGNIAVEVTGTGNLALEDKQELSFGQTGLATNTVNVKISKVNVQVGDVVKQGTVLVNADTQDWQNTVTSLQHTLDSANASLLQAQANLETVQYHLKEQADIQTIQDNITNSQAQYQAAQINFAGAANDNNSGNQGYWSNVMKQTQADIAQYQQQMADLLADPAHSGVATAVADIVGLELAVQQAQNSVTLAQNNVDDAQTNLANEKNSSQEIDAPINGLITQVNTSVGNIVSRTATLIEIADPTKFIANILVTETDIPSIKIGDDASVSLDALSGYTFPAKVTQIAPLATVSSGVVNYSVTVELSSTTPIATRTPSGVSRGGFPTNLPPGVTPTRISPSRTFTGTPAPGGLPTNAGATRPSAAAGAGSQASTLPSVTLKDGLSTTVNIIVQQKTGILVIPSRAVTKKGSASTVQVVKGTVTETRTIQTGITDSNNIEVTSGLSEGEQVVVPASTTAVAPTTTSAPNRPLGGGGGGIRIP